MLFLTQFSIGCKLVYKAASTIPKPPPVNNKIFTMDTDFSVACASDFPIVMHANNEGNNIDELIAEVGDIVFNEELDEKELGLYAELRMLTDKEIIDQGLDKMWTTYTNNFKDACSSCVWSNQTRVDSFWTSQSLLYTYQREASHLPSKFDQ